ncbi:hypothetical protein V7O66_12760 [Methanolobus sp. ZRKC3]|uniref:hypothetical protein n=1 Tax=Methanolobus sp. ZRKC3 TaxID=3125786 RepID=UPI0032540A5B
MNRKILITGLIILFLLSCGCAGKKQAASDDIIESDDVSDLAPSPEEGLVEDTVSNESDELAPLSQEELDNLKAELEEMEFDDLGGLSE